MILFERTYQFSSSHLYWRDDWSDERNRATFGKCAIRPAHGHNYRLTIRLRGEVDPETGFLIDLGELDRMVRERVVDRLDHRHVNEVVPEFAEGGKIPTSENLAQWIADTLRADPAGRATLHEVRLQEEDRIAAIWQDDLRVHGS